MDDSLPFAPELPRDLTWLHVERPVDLRHDLANHVVLLAFVSPSCIHSRAAMATLDLVDRRFDGRPLAVLAVCTPRVAAERDAERMAWCAQELGWRMPIVLDPEVAAWRAYDCRVWPTVVLVDSTGRMRFRGGGEPVRERLIAAVDNLLTEVEYGGYGYGGSELPRRRPAPAPAASVFAWPTALAAAPDRGSLFVADAGRHQVVEVCATSGAIKQRIGCGLAGAGDGLAAVASFHRPQGLCWDAAQGRLLVVDTDNHLLRAVDVDGGTVTTIAGSGRRGRDKSGGSRATQQDLAFPWGVVAADDGVWITCPGVHQIWWLDGSDGTVSAFIGTGNEHRIDGLASSAALGQPRGICRRERQLWWVDATTHTLRSFDGASGDVATVIGGGGEIGFGAEDGALDAARLQEPSAVIGLDDDRLLVVDTGNGALREVDLAAATVTTLPTPPGGLQRATGAAWMADDGGRGTLWVADGGGRRLLRFDLDERQWHEVVVSGDTPGATPLHCRLRASADCELLLPLPLPAGARLVDEVPVRVTCHNRAGAALRHELTDTYEAPIDGAPLRITAVPTGEGGEGLVEVRIECASTHEHDGAVHGHDRIVLLAMTLDADAPTMAKPQAAAAVEPSPPTEPSS